MGMQYRTYGKVELEDQFTKIELEHGLGTYTNDSHIKFMERQMVVSPDALEAQDVAMYMVNQKLNALKTLLTKGGMVEATSLYRQVAGIYNNSFFEIPATEFIAVDDDTEAGFAITDRLTEGTRMPKLAGKNKNKSLKVKWLALNTSAKVMGQETKQLMGEILSEVFKDTFPDGKSPHWETMRSAFTARINSMSTEEMLADRYVNGLMWLKMLEREIRRLYKKGVSGSDTAVFGKSDVKILTEYEPDLRHDGFQNRNTAQLQMYYVVKLIGRVLDYFPPENSFIRLAETSVKYSDYVLFKEFIYKLRVLHMLLDMMRDEITEAPSLTVWYAEATNRRWSLAVRAPLRDINWKLTEKDETEKIFDYKGLTMYPWEFTGLSGLEKKLKPMSSSEDYFSRDVVCTTEVPAVSTLAAKTIVTPKEFKFNDARSLIVNVMESTAYSPNLMEKVPGIDLNGTALCLNVSTIGSVIQALYPDPYRHGGLGRTLGPNYHQNGDVLFNYKGAGDLGVRWADGDIESIVPINFK